MLGQWLTSEAGASVWVKGVNIPCHCHLSSEAMIQGKSMDRKNRRNIRVVSSKFKILGFYFVVSKI